MNSSGSFKYEEVTGLKFNTSLLGTSSAFSHIYFVDGLLIDTGHSRKRKTVLSAVSGLPVKQILVTHHHEDHTGNLQAIHQHFNCEIVASEKCCDIMKHPPKLSLAQKLYWGNRKAVHDLVPVNQSIETGKFRFDLIDISGHADDMIALYEPQKKWLFSADLYIHSRVGYFLKEESIKQQIQSIKTVLQLDFEVMFCSHNPQLKQGKVKLLEKLHYLEDFVSNVQRLYNEGYSGNAIFKALGLKEYRLIKLLSAGQLSKENMVHSVIRDFC